MYLNIFNDCHNKLPETNNSVLQLIAVLNNPVQFLPP